MRRRREKRSSSSSDFPLSFPLKHSIIIIIPLPFGVGSSHKSIDYFMIILGDAFVIPF